jgi:hypothetical protein
MASQKLIWIALPGGLRTVGGARRARVSVYVTPQLKPDGTTLTGSDWVSWPARLRKPDVSFRMRFGNTTVPASLIDVLKPDLWTALFNASTFVRPHSPDDVSGAFQSYPAAKLHDLFKDGYQEIFHKFPVKLPKTLPSGFEGLVRLFIPDSGGDEFDYLAMPSDDRSRARISRELFRPDRPDRRRAAVLDRLVDLALEEAARQREGSRRESVEIVPDTDDPASYLEQFYAFHQQPTGTVLAPPATADDARMDFHQHLAKLGEYPGLQRALGLVLDFDVDVTNIPQTAPGAHGLLSVVPTFGTALVPSAGNPVTPPTAFTLTADRFEAASDPSLPRDAVRGLVNLGLTVGAGSNEPQFRLIQLDVDGAGFKTIDLLTRAATGSLEAESALAALRSAGVSIVRYGNGRFLMDAIGIGLEKMKAALAGRNVTLFAENLVRGYRVDVRDAGGWRSLHHRDGTYRFTGLSQSSSITDEGYVQPSLVQPPTPGGPVASTHNASAPNYLSEALFLWQGWSLAARRPGPAIPQPDEPTASPAADPRIEVSFRAPSRSLPRLRFGSDYQFRVRLVDLAGGGLTSSEADAVLAALEASGQKSPVLPPGSTKMRYQRFDVAPSPVVLPRVPPGHGASVDRVVLRSNHNVSAQDYTQQHPEHVRDSERHVLPPKVPQLLAEASGLFDASVGTGAEFEKTHALVKRSMQSLGDDEAHPSASVTVPYLPDPLAAGVAFRDLPAVVSGVVGSVESGRFQIKSRLPSGPEAVTGSVVPVSFDAQAWPEAKSLRLVLKEGAGTPTWSPADRELTVFLPKGESRQISLSSHLASETPLLFMGIWSWLMERLDKLVASGQLTPTDRNSREKQLKALAVLGLIWMLTPARELTLVHAVQQPLKPPVIQRLLLSRPPRATFAGVDAAIEVHSQTSGQLELRATWTEPSDGGATTQMSGSVFATPTVIPPGRDTMTFTSVSMDVLDRKVSDAVENMRLQFEDFLRTTRKFQPPNANAVRQVVKFKADWQPMLFAYDGTTLSERWRGLSSVGSNINSLAIALTKQPPEVPDSFPAGLHGEAQRLGRVALELRDQAEDALATIDTMRAGPHHEFGDTKYRRVTYRAVATTRFGDCFADQNLPRTRESAGFVVHLASTASPQRPQVRYIVPVFPWKRQGDVAQGFTSVRGGGALRVYLDGPWYSSGAGELLGVVVASPIDPNPFSQVNLGADLADWGRDPIWKTQEFRVLPLETDFLNAVTEPVDVRRPDKDRRQVTVIGFNVSFDDQGRCFSDIVIDPERSYQPFVRLALTRYQPNSITGMEISPIVLTDFAQLSPRRAVSVVRREQLLYQVTVSGITHQTTNSQGRTGTRVRVGVQQRIPGTSDDAGWQTADATATPGQPGTDQLWTGTIRVPNLGATPLRLLIEELEDHASTERVVFAETVPI